MCLSIPLALSVSDFPSSVLQFSASYIGWRTIGGCRKLLSYRAMLMSMKKNFYEALMGVFGRTRFSFCSIVCIDGALIKNKDMIIAGWAEYLQSLLNNVHTTDPGFFDDLPTQPIIPKLDDPPSFDKVEKAILSFKDNKAAGPDKIPADVIKYGRSVLHRRILNFIIDSWSAMCFPQQWKNAIIILAYGQRGDRAECGNSRGIPFSL